MTDSKRLRCWISEHGLKLKYVASILGISAYSLQKKIDNQNEFKASELSAFCSELGMTAKDRESIFFSSM